MNPVRAKLHALVDELVDAIEASGNADEWIDQTKSPLGRRRHLELARAGALPSSRDGRKVLIRRRDIDAYLESKKTVWVDPGAEEEREVSRVVEALRRTA